jgi:serine/threonine protein kinase
MTSLPAVPPFAPGTQFLNKYDFSHRIGRGSFGEVWLATDRALNRPYAIKILDAGVDVDQRLREARVGNAFTHGNLAKVWQADVATDGRVVIAMDYYQGGPATNLKNPGNFIPLPQALRVTLDVLRGLEHLHSFNVFHNDIKPENILLGDNGQGILTDYGIVGISLDGKPVAPVNWYVLHAAPEVSTGIDARTDIFQMGLTLFRLLVSIGDLEARYGVMGRNDYLAALAAGTLLRPADFPPHVPASVRRAILRAIAADPADRFQTALEMRRALERLSFAGHWTVDPTGNFVGVGNGWTYRFELLQKTRSQFSFLAFRRNAASGNETAIRKFSARDVTKAEAFALHKQFVAAVVNGDA